MTMSCDRVLWVLLGCSSLLLSNSFAPAWAEQQTTEHHFQIFNPKTLLIESVETATQATGSQIATTTANVAQTRQLVRWIRLRSNTGWRLAAQLTRFASFSYSEARTRDFAIEDPATLSELIRRTYILPQQVQVTFSDKDSGNQSRVEQGKVFFAPKSNELGVGITTLNDLRLQPRTAIASKIPISSNPQVGDDRFLQYSATYTFSKDIPAGSAEIVVTYTLHDDP